MAGVRRVSLENAVGGRVIAGCVHGVRAGLVERGGEPDIPGGEAGDGDFGHGCWVEGVGR